MTFDKSDSGKWEEIWTASNLILGKGVSRKGHIYQDGLNQKTLFNRTNAPRLGNKFIATDTNEKGELCLVLLLR